MVEGDEFPERGFPFVPTVRVEHVGGGAEEVGSSVEGEDGVGCFLITVRTRGISMKEECGRKRVCVKSKRGETHRFEFRQEYGLGPGRERRRHEEVWCRFLHSGR